MKRLASRSNFPINNGTITSVFYMELGQFSVVVVLFLLMLNHTLIRTLFCRLQLLTSETAGFTVRPTVFPLRLASVISVTRDYEGYQ